jgi:uncharacterized protein (DUF3084 family)
LRNETQQFDSRTQQFDSRTQQFDSRTQQFDLRTQQFDLRTQQFDSRFNRLTSLQTARWLSSAFILRGTDIVEYDKAGFSFWERVKISSYNFLQSDNILNIY